MLSFARASIEYVLPFVWLKVNLSFLEPILPFEINEIPQPSTFAAEPEDALSIS